MGLEDVIIPESSESGGNSAEISEKYKEAVKKSGSGIKKTQKDESKARKYDFLLAKFLVEMILKQKYDELLEELFRCFDLGYGTNFLLGVLSLIYLPISHEIRKYVGKPEITFHYHPSADLSSFDEQNIPDILRQRINFWIEDMESVISLEVSNILTKRTLSLVLYDDAIRSFTSSVFSFFFGENGFEMKSEVARSYSEFVLSQLEKSLKKIVPEMELEWQNDGLEI